MTWKDTSSDEEHFRVVTSATAGYGSCASFVYDNPAIDSGLSANSESFTARNEYFGCGVFVQVCAIKSGCAPSCSPQVWQVFDISTCYNKDLSGNYFVGSEEFTFLVMNCSLPRGACYAGDSCWTACSIADFNGDGVVNLSDWNLIPPCLGVYTCSCSNEGSMDVALFNDANSNGIMDSGESLVPTDALSSTTVSVV
ncbi:MAG: hypothetical protein Q8N84_03295, partial [bacterium]|nr:hypothetical protein [bacterium]